MTFIVVIYSPCWKIYKLFSYVTYLPLLLKYLHTCLYYLSSYSHATIIMSITTIEQYSALPVSRRKKLNKDELMVILESQIGSPALVPEDTFRNILKDTIDRSLDDKILEFNNMIDEATGPLKSDIETLKKDNKVLKQIISEQQKFIESIKRDTIKDNVYITGLPKTMAIEDNQILNDRSEMIHKIFSSLNSELIKEEYEIAKIFDPKEGYTNYTALVKFKSSDSKKKLMPHCKKLKGYEASHPFFKIFIKNESTPLTRSENIRLYSEFKKLKDQHENDENTTVHLEKGKLSVNGSIVDQFSLNNQLFH